MAWVFVLLYLTFRRISDALLILATLPFALAGGFWLMYALGYNMSIASAIGFIALGGVASEIGVVMLVYVNQAVATRTARGTLNDRDDLVEAIVEGAALRVRPIAMTVAVIVAGLLPIMWGSGTGSEVMRRIAAPMVGGMVTAMVLSMLVVPAAYLLIRRPSTTRSTWRCSAILGEIRQWQASSMRSATALICVQCGIPQDSCNLVTSYI